MSESKETKAVRIRIVTMLTALFALSAVVAPAQQETQAQSEQRVPLTQTAVAHDAKGAAALEATLRTTALNGAPDAPVTNIRIVIKNVSASFYTYVSGLATFYDSAGVRCGEGVFKVDALAQNESAETDAPGLRVTCAPASWRIVATNLLTRSGEQTTATAETRSGTTTNLVINIDGEEHPIQIGKPMVLNLGNKQRTITVRAAP
jgi:hypothetical protein